jgi:hypothetical protein
MPKAEAAPVIFHGGMHGVTHLKAESTGKAGTRQERMVTTGG